MAQKIYNNNKMSVEEQQFVIDKQFQAQVGSQSDSSNIYSTITFQTRFRFLEMVCIEKYYVLKAAQILGLKLSTAKYILRSYRRKGKIMKKFKGEKLTQVEIDDLIEDLRVRQSKVKKLNKRELRILNEKLCRKNEIQEQDQIPIIKQKLSDRVLVKNQQEIYPIKDDVPQNKPLPQPFIKNYVPQQCQNNICWFPMNTYPYFMPPMIFY